MTTARFAKGTVDGTPFVIQVAEHETFETLKKHFESCLPVAELTVTSWYHSDLPLGQQFDK